MSRDSEPRWPGEAGDDDATGSVPGRPAGPAGPAHDPGRLGPVRPGALVAVALVGLVGGWAVRPVVLLAGGLPPRVGWVPPASTFVAALVLAMLARATHRALQQRRGGLRAHEAVNRLVLAKACALTAALVGGAYLGYALTWAGSASELAGERALQSLVGAVGAALTLLMALLLERACRVRGGDPRA